MKCYLLLALAMGTAWLVAGETNDPTPAKQEVVEVQGIKIWKTGKPTNAYTVIANENLERVTWAEARNRIALGVRARNGNGAIVTSMTTVPRVDISQTTGISQLDGVNVRYAVILLKP